MHSYSLNMHNYSCTSLLAYMHACFQTVFSECARSGYYYSARSIGLATPDYVRTSISLLALLVTMQIFVVVLVVVVFVVSCNWFFPANHKSVSILFTMSCILYCIAYCCGSGRLSCACVYLVASESFITFWSPNVAQCI